MKTTDVNDSLVGKRCKCIFTGLMVSGVIEETGVNKYTAEVKVRFDEPWKIQFRLPPCAKSKLTPEKTL